MKPRGKLLTAALSKGYGGSKVPDEGSQTGQTGDGEPFVLPEFDKVDEAWLSEELSTRKIPHNKRWAKRKLYDLLADTVKPAAE